LDSQLRAGTVVMSSREVPMKRSKKDGKVKVEMSWNDAHYLHKYTMVDNIDNDKKEKKKNILLPKENKIQAK